MPQNTEGTVPTWNLCPQILSEGEGAQEEGRGVAGFLATPSHWFLLAMTKCSVFFLCLLPGPPQPGMCGPAISRQRALRGCRAPVQVLTSPLPPSARLSLPGSPLILLLKCTSENKPHQLPLEVFQRRESPPVPSSPLVSTGHGCHPHCPPASVLMPSGSWLGCKAGGAG